METCRNIYTLDKSRFIDLILEAFCEKVEKNSAVLIGQTGNILDFGSIYISSRKLEYFKNEGFEVQETRVVDYTGKKMVNGVPIKVDAISGSNYRKKGIKVSITCEGMTPKELSDDAQTKEIKFLRYLKKYKIPLSKVCAESSLGCIYKFPDNLNV